MLGVMASWRRPNAWKCCDSNSSLEARVVCLVLLLVSSATHVLSRDRLSTGGHLDEFGPLKTVCGWQLPDGPVSKVLAIFPGGGVIPHSFWDRSSACPSCTGLPENRKFVIDALARNYAVFIPLAFTDCFNPWPLDNPEIQNFQAIFSHWKRSQGLENVSTVGVGSSCGGHYLFTLGLLPGLFDSITVLLVHGKDDAMAAATHEFPPTLFIHMPKDDAMNGRVTKRRRELGDIGVVTEEVRWFEHPVTRDWFSQLIPGVDVELSTAIQEAVRAEGWLEDGSDLLNSTAYRDDFDSAVGRWNVLTKDPFRSEHFTFQDSILQELNVAFAFHTTVSRLNDHMFAWFEGGYDDKRRVAIA